MGSLCSESSCVLWSGGVFPWKSGQDWVPPFSFPSHPVTTHSHRGPGEVTAGLPGASVLGAGLTSPHLLCGSDTSQPLGLQTPCSTPGSDTIPTGSRS